MHLAKSELGTDYLNLLGEKKVAALSIKTCRAKPYR